MNNRSRFFVSSALGAVAIHVLFVACSSPSAPSSATDSGVMGMIRDVMNIEVPDANAQVDAGACTCPPGPAGPAGPAGATGPAGPMGPNTIRSATFSCTDSGCTSVRQNGGNWVSSVRRLGPGEYLLLRSASPGFGDNINCTASNATNWGSATVLEVGASSLTVRLPAMGGSALADGNFSIICHGG